MLNAKAAKHSVLSPVAAALWAALCTSWVRFAPAFVPFRRGRQRSGYTIVNQNPQPLSSSSRSNWSFKCRRAAFLIARRSSTTPCFSAWRSRRVRGSTDCGTCRIFGRRAPIFRSFGFAYGSMTVLRCVLAIKIVGTASWCAITLSRDDWVNK